MNQSFPNVTLVVGKDRLDTMPRKYCGSSEELIKQCYRVSKKHSKIYTTESIVITAFLSLHSLGKIVLILYYKDKEIHVDEKGQFITPWPDELFEMSFNLMFHTEQYRKVVDESV